MIFSVSPPRIACMADAVAALQEAALGHSAALDIGHDRMLRGYGCLWMLVRGRVRLARLPLEKPRIETFLRRPSATASLRDYTFFDGDECVGSAVQTWVLVDAVTRHLVGFRRIDCFRDLPTPAPERTDVPIRLTIPKDMSSVANWVVEPTEIDENGHLNNVCYVRRAAPLVPSACTALDIQYDRECFVGDALTLCAAPDGFVCGMKENGEISFRLRLWSEML